MLLERKSLLTLTKEQDDLILLKTEMILEQSIVIDTLQNRIADNSDKYNNLVDDLNMQKNRNKNIKLYGGVAIAACLIVILLK